MNSLHDSKEWNSTEVPIPRFVGERYEAEIPDTLDLAERAELAINSITRMLDPDRDYQMYAEMRFTRRPPVIRITGLSGSISCANKHLESLPLVRLMSGSTFNIEVDSKLMESMLHMTGKDGCVYIPKCKAVNPFYPPPIPEPLAFLSGEGRHILALCMWHQHEQNPLWRTLVEKKIERLAELVTEEEDGAYFKRDQYTEAETGPLPEELPHGVGPLGLVGDEWDGFKAPVPFTGIKEMERRRDVHQTNFCLTRSLCVYYNLTGYEPGLELAGKLIRGALKRWKGFEDDGRWLIYHFHTASASLLAMLEYAMIMKDRELLEFVERCYEYGKAVSDTTVGFFPEIVPGFDIRKIHAPEKIYSDCETCEVVDMIGLALKLTQAGAGDYWEDVDRWTRNQFVENQLTPDKLPVLRDSAKLFEEVPVEPWESEDIERVVGGFAGAALTDDFGGFVAHACCTGNAARTLYWVWDSILTREDKLVRVNLLLNRASPWLDVDSYLPCEGKVVLKVKDADKVAIRIPEWTDREQVACKVNDKEKEFAWSGNYVEMNGLKAGDTVTVKFPMKEETLFKLIGDIPYKLTIRGNTVVDMEKTVMDAESILTVTHAGGLSDGYGHLDALRKEPFCTLYQ